MNKSGIAAPVISHPRGGGAISAIGETFSPDLHTGTGNLTVPLAVPSGRNGFGPQLSLVYSTGQGNGPFGLGWHLSVPGVSRDTSKGLPVYSDDNDAFLLSGMERLVPTGPAAAGETRYRPRTEGSFARIIHRVGDRDDFWEVRTRDGLVSRYGTPGMREADPAVVRDPDDARRVFAWSLVETHDPFGNRIEYEYERDVSRVDGPHRWDQIRLAQIRYADHGPSDQPSFLVTVDFAYEDRPDPFSSYRVGFEIRTTRRCARIEVRTHADQTRLTRIYHFRYADDRTPPHNGISLLRRVEVEGVDGDARERLPPLELDYTRFRPEHRSYQPLSAVGNALPERSLAHPDFELADLFGSGLPDVVQIGDVNRYWRNLGDGRFDLPHTLDGLPEIRLGDPGVTLGDADGDGHIDLVVSKPGLAGYLPLTAPESEEREPFLAYASAAPFQLEDPEVRLIDLDGDGVVDALRTGASFELYYHDRERGWIAVETRGRDQLDRFPDVNFSDPRVKLADMTGDGLVDIAFVDGDRVDYWPYLGYGRWGARVTMRGQLAFPDSQLFGGIGFDPRRVLLGDVDGDGVADLVYVESGRVTIWLNQSGNRWSEPIVVHGTPPITNVDAVRLADILGNGTDGILWSYDAGTFADSSYKFLDLTGGEKPYLLCERNNHAGARTRVEYAPSTRFYVADEAHPDTRWRGRLPFPVQVVARVEVIDELSRGKLTTEYRYHQGYWDGAEREFRGFGLVEQLDTESFARYHGSGLHGDVAFEPIEQVQFSPPTLTRSWFHQGEIVDARGERRESDPVGPLGDEPAFPPHHRSELTAIAAVSAQEGDPRRRRQALRALRGSLLRSELYALDDSPYRGRPYTVTESLYDVREIAVGDEVGDGVYAPLPVATRTTQWERGTEPMTRFAFVGGYDAYGLPSTQLEVAVPRGRDPLVPAIEAPEPYLATYVVTERARRDDEHRFLVDRVARTSRYEVRDDGTSSVSELRDAVTAGTAELRVIGHARTYFDGEAFIGLPLGQLGDYGASVRREALAFQDSFLETVLSPGYLAAENASWSEDYPPGYRDDLPALGGYVHYNDNEVGGSPGGYYVVTERARYDFQSGNRARGMLQESRDALGSAATIELDVFDLFPARVTDAAGLETAATYDYRVLSPRLITDVNGNTTEAAYSPAGLLVAQYVRGKHGEGDIAHPSVRFEYDLHAFDTRGEPLSVRTIRRVHHDGDADVEAAERDRTIESVEYSDGLGRVLQTRAQAEDVLFGDPAFGGSGLALDASAPSSPAVGHAAPDHVVVSGWQTYDNKGRVVEKYEPFFSRGWAFRAPGTAERGQKTTMFYDARGQLVRTVRPDGAEQRVVPGIPNDLADPARFVPTPWESYVYDANDNAERTHGTAANNYASHWNTPASVKIDALGRTIEATARNGPNDSSDWFTTRSTFDIQGNLITLIDALGREAFRYAYDLTGRRWRVDSIDAGRRDTVFDALGQPVESRDAKGALVLQAYDVLHRPTRMWARDAANAPMQLRHVLRYGDNGTAEERAAAREVNLLAKLASVHDGAGLLVHHAFDFKGNLVEKSRRVIADAPMREVFADAAANAWQVAPFAPDWAPPPGQTLADLEATLLEPFAYETSTTFDALGRARWVRLPRDVEERRRIIQPTYNRAGALEQVRLDGELYVERLAYDASGRRVLVAYGNGTMTRYAYDPLTFRLGRMRSERFTRPAASTYTPAGDVSQDCTYAYDLVGNIVSIIDRAPAAGIRDNPDAAMVDDPVLAQLLATGDALIRHFTYDPVYRLKVATGRECDRPSEAPPWLDEPRCSDLTRTRAYTEVYDYDPAGSVKSLAHQNATGGFTRTYEIEPANNRLRALQIGPTTTYEYRYDANGNTLSEGASRHFEWNHADQLKAYRTQTTGAEPSVHAQYLYDAAGHRVKKLVRKQGGRIEITHYIDGTFEHHRWGAGTSSGENNDVHVMDGARRIALVRIGPTLPGDTSPTSRYELADHVGSANVTLDSAGALVDREDFTPYGETSFGSFAKKRYRFVGMERDEESFLSHHGARCYAPWLVRWQSSDPIGPGGGATNVYIYALDNPLNCLDRTGNGPESYYSYTRDRGDQWWGYYLGTAAHIVIGYDYLASHTGEVAYLNVVSIGEILDSSRLGDSSRLTAKERALMPDITVANEWFQEVYEIKPGLNRKDQAEQAALGIAQLDTYVAALNKGAHGGTTFSKGHPFHGAAYVAVPIEGRNTLWRLSWHTTFPGLIQYKWERSDSKNWKYESFDEVMARDKWIEVPVVEQKNYAEAVYDSVIADTQKAARLEVIDRLTTPLHLLGFMTLNVMFGAIMEHRPMSPARSLPSRAPQPIAPPVMTPDPDNIIPFPVKGPTSPQIPQPAPSLSKAA